MDVDSIAQKSRVDDIAVQSLDDKQDDQGGQKPAQVTRDQADQDRGAVGDHGSDIGDQVADPAQYPDDDRVVHTDQGEGGADEDGHDQGVDQLSADIARKDCIRVLCKDTEGAAGLFAADSQQDPAPVASEVLPVHQEIDGKDHGKEGPCQEAADLCDPASKPAAEPAGKARQALADLTDGRADLLG